MSFAFNATKESVPGLLKKEKQQIPNTQTKIFHSQDSLGKQCWVVLGRVQSTVRSDPAQLVTALRIVEREERYVK